MRSFRETPRDQRLPYAGKVRVLLDFSPWRLALALDGLNLSATGVLGHWPKTSRRADDAEALLQVGDPYQLQLEHVEGHLPVPVVKARLARREQGPAGLALGFQFEDAGGELLGLIHELGIGCTPPKR